SANIAHRIDAEEVIQSVYRSFFADARAGRYEVERGGDLWQLLVTITLHKLQTQVRRLNAQKRDAERECSFGSEDSLVLLQPQALAREPSPVEAVALTDLLERLMQQLDPEQRRMLELRLQGYTLEEIAADIHLSRRTVCRALDQIKQLLERWTAKDPRS